MNRALTSIRTELDQRIVQLESQGKLLEAQRLKMRTEYDLEMLQEMGFCNGIENYSRHLSGRPPGSKPFTLLDFFPKDFLLVIDESHATIPQIGGMYEGDKSRKTVLVEYGFRLPSALDNRPLNFPEFMGNANQLVYVSATPAEFEIKNSIVGNSGYFPHKRARIGEEELVPFVVAGEVVGQALRLPPGDVAGGAPALQISRTDQSPNQFDVHTPGAPLVVEQIIRPTGLLDPKITLKELKNQIDDTIELCRQRVERQERVLVTTLTKRTAEDLSDYLRDVGLKVRYLHSDIDTIERVEILRGLRAAEFDILVGINLLREGLDLPEVSLVCILDADKEGFLRSQTSLIQTAGRAARHINGEVVLFADTVTQSMQALISISDYRRSKQMEYNEKHNITPQTVRRAVQESLHTILRGREIAASVIQEAGGDFNLTELLRELEEEMEQASANLEFERAALLRDQIMEVKTRHGPDEDRAEAQAGEIHPRLRPPPLAGLNLVPQVEPASPCPDYGWAVCFAFTVSIASATGNSTRGIADCDAKQRLIVLQRRGRSCVLGTGSSGNIDAVLLPLVKKWQSASCAHLKISFPTNGDRGVARLSLDDREARRWSRCRCRRSGWAYCWGRRRRRCRWGIWVRNGIGNSRHSKLIHCFEEKPIRIFLDRDDAKATARILEIAFAPGSISRGRTIERHSFRVWGRNAHLGKAGISAVINRAQMQVAGDEKDPLNLIRVDEVPQIVPLRLVTLPAVERFRGCVGSDRSEDHFPLRGGSQQTVLQPLQLSGGAKIVAIEHALVGIIRIVFIIALAAAIKHKEIDLCVTELLPDSRRYTRQGICRHIFLEGLLTKTPIDIRLGRHYCVQSHDHPTDERLASSGGSGGRNHSCGECSDHRGS